MMIKQVNSKILLLTLLLIPFNQVFMNYLLKEKFFDPLKIATNYLIQPTLVVNILSLVIFSLIIFGLGKLNLGAIFITRKKMYQGITLILCIWLLSQIISLSLSAILTRDVIYSENPNENIGSFVGQFFGNAAFEELIYRGFFFMQLFLLLRTKTNNWKALIASIILSQLLFALIHIPNRLMINQVDNLASELIKLFIIGVVLTIIYARSTNLIFLIGVHSLINVPLNFLEPVFPVELIIFIITIIIALFWNKIITQGKNPFLQKTDSGSE